VTQAGASPSSDELVRQAQAHEAVHEDDRALRRYTEALTLDPTSAAAWLGLAELRVRTGDRLEAERVYTAALSRIPSFAAALEGRAEVRWLLGRHAEARADLETYAEIVGDEKALRLLADWFASDGLFCAELATWRRLAPLAPTDARRMVRALLVVVDGTDPASSPVEPDETRWALAQIARQAPRKSPPVEKAATPKVPATQTTPRASSHETLDTRASESP
jgi:tetratricopeptide (TPR) repeat protein